MLENTNLLDGAHLRIALIGKKTPTGNKRHTLNVRNDLQNMDENSGSATITAYPLQEEEGQKEGITHRMNT